MEEEYIKTMSDAVDFIKETKTEATKYYNYIWYCNNNQNIHFTCHN